MLHAQYRVDCSRRQRRSVKRLREMEDGGGFDSLGCDWDAFSASEACPCGFSCRNAFTELISERSNAILKTHHAEPNPKTAQRPLGGPSFPSILIFSTSKVVLSPPPFLLPAACNTDSSVRSTFPPGKFSFHSC